MRNFFAHRAVQTISLLIIFWMLKDYLPVTALSFFYGVSLLIKDVLVLMMPLTVFFFIAHTIKGFDKKAHLFILVLMAFEILSNTLSVWFGYGASHVFERFFSQDFSALKTIQNVTFDPLFRLGYKKPDWWSADKGALLGIIIGLCATFGFFEKLKHPLEKGKKTFDWLLTRVFSKTIPLFILGFAISLYKTQTLEIVQETSSYLVVFLMVCLVLYVGFLIFLSAGFKVKKALALLTSLLPAGGVALSSGCSLSTMPWTIEGVKNHLKNPNFAQGVIPATTNIQQIGDCLTNTFLCSLIYGYFYGSLPDLWTWTTFTVIFVMARFATAAVLGGAIFVMLPLYESYLSFNGEMIALILAFNVLLDPLVTSSNVMANGALCVLFEKVWAKFQHPMFNKKSITSVQRNRDASRFEKSA